MTLNDIECIECIIRRFLQDGPVGGELRALDLLEQLLVLVPAGDGVGGGHEVAQPGARLLVAGGRHHRHHHHQHRHHHPGHHGGLSFK